MSVMLYQYHTDCEIESACMLSIKQFSLSGSELVCMCRIYYYIGMIINLEKTERQTIEIKPAV